MKKAFFYPLWKIEALEDKLSNLGQMGWRLDRLSPINRFHFIESPSNATSYFFTYKLTKSKGMTDIERHIKSKYGATSVCGTPTASIFCSTRVYRIESCEDLERLRFYRNIYLQYIVRQKMLFGLFVPILCSLLLIHQIINCGMPVEDMPQWVFLGFVALLSLIYCGYQLYGLRRLKQQYRRMFPHIHISYDDFRF